MFVVRIIRDEDKTDFKAFERREDAFSRFDQAYRQTDDGEFESVAVFDVMGEREVRPAIEKVKCASNDSVQLLKIKEPFEIEIAKMDIEL